MITALAILAGCRVPVSPPPEALLSVSETASGRLHLLDAETGESWGEQCLYPLFPDQCSPDPKDTDHQCLVFQSLPGSWSQDGQTHDTLQATFSFREPDDVVSIGGAVEVIPGHPPTLRWALSALTWDDALDRPFAARCNAGIWSENCALSGPHAQVVVDDLLVIADTGNSRVLWVEIPEPTGDLEGNRTGQVVAILDAEHPDFGAFRYVNHLQLIEDGGERLLLVTFKSHLSESGLVDEGSVALWSIDNPADPALLWRYPESGTLAAVHHGILSPDRTRLVYSHSRGASVDDPPRGSVGVARLDDLRSPPIYLADLVAPADAEPLGFVREADPLEDGRLLVTDSGCENQQDDCDTPGQIYWMDPPALETTALSGGYSEAHSEQRFVEADVEAVPHSIELTFPYEADLLIDRNLELAGDPLGDCGDG